MLDASTELLNQIAETSVVTFKATLTLADGTVVELTDDNEDFMEGGMSLEEATSSTSSFDVGAAVIGQLTLVLNNYDERFSSYDFTDATIVPYVGVELDSGTEWLQRGVYTVEQPDSYGYTITLTALDNMSLLETEFSEVTAIYPATVQGLIEAICNHCGITLATTGFDNYSYSIDEAPSDTTLTCLAAVGYLAQIVGCYARVNKDGELCIDWYDTTAFDSEDWLDGGEFDEDSPHSTGDTADGGDFEDYSTGDAADGGAFVDRPYLHLYAHTSCTVTTDDVVITGVQVTACDGTIVTETTEETTEEDEDGNEVTTETVTETEETVSGETELYGADGYIITIESNPFIAYGTAADVAEMIGAKAVGMQFRPFSATGLADPTAEAGDPVYLEDVRGNAYQSYLTSLSWKAGSAETYTCSAETPSRNSASTYSATTAAIAAATQAATSALNKSATLSVTVDGIISKVESEYTTTEDLEELLGDYATTDAVSATLSNYSTTTETAEMITSEVSSALYTTDSDGNTTAIYATTSEVTQTAEDITATFTSSTGSNLLTDPGFESMAYGGTLPSGFTYSAASPNSGAYCMACTGAGTRYYFNHAYGDATDPVAITVEPGETYLYSMYYKKSSSSTAWASDNMKLRIATADGNDTLIASHSTGSIGTDWTQITGTWTNSAGYTEVYVMVATSVTSGTVYVDDAFFGTYTASGTLIRESSDGVEVAKYSGSSYSTTRTLMAADGFHVQDSSGTDLTVVDSDGMTVYAGGSTAAEFGDDGMVLYPAEDMTLEFTSENISMSSAGLSSASITYDTSSDESTLGIYADAINIESGSSQVIIDNTLYIDSSMVLVEDNRLYVTRDALGVWHQHSDTNYEVGMGVGSGGYNRGLYDGTKSRWIAYADSDGQTILQANDGLCMLTSSNGTKRMRYVDCGTIEVGGTANAVCSEPVTFNVTFESVPIVVATALSTVPGTVTEVTVGGRSTTGCTVYQYRTSSATNSVMWIAVGYLA